jgi:transglutaminase-like putative cysteine protease
MTLNARMTITAAVACVLTSTALYPLYYGSEWFYAGAGAVIVVAACGALSRLRVLPAPVCLAISLLGLLLYLNVVFEAHYAVLAVIPTPTSIAKLWALAGTGITDSAKYVQAPDLPGLVLLAAGGIGITAALTDLIAVRLQSAALAGLPLLVLFTVPVTMNAHGGPGTVVVFCLGAAGYLAMLSADGRERIRVWGRLVSLWRSGSADHGSYPGARRADPAASPGERAGPDTRPLAAAGRRVGLASVVLAICVPLIVPGLHPSKLFSTGPGIGGTGGGQAQPLSESLADTLTELRESHPTPVLSYTTTASPSLQTDDAQYLQQYVLDTLTDSGWETSNFWAGATSSKSIPLPPGLTEVTDAQAVQTSVTVLAKGALATNSAPTFLPVPYPPIQLTVPPGVWVVDYPDLMVFSDNDYIAAGSYTATSYVVDPTATQLNDAAVAPLASLKPDLELPASYQSAALKQIARQVTTGARTEFEKVQELAEWLSGPDFRYSPAAQTFDSAAGLLNYLTNGKAGVCVQSAWAMTVLARLLGIPARMVQGFTAGTEERKDFYVVKTSDAHAWTEVYFSGYGWIRFEPTPAGQGTARAPNYMTEVVGQGRLSGPGSSTPPGRLASQTPSASHPFGITRPTPAGAGAPGSAASKPAGTPWSAIALAVLVAIALVCAVIAMSAPAARRGDADRPARRRSPATLGAAALVTAIVALALYRLLASIHGLDLRADWAAVGIAFGAAAAVILAGPVTGRFILRRLRWMRASDDASRAHTAWREFRADLADFGVACRPSEPPRALANRVAAGLAQPAREAVHRLALAEERASYSAHPSDSANLRRDGAAARRGIGASVRRGGRWRARIFPASVMTALADGAARIPDHLAARVSARRAERKPVG